MKTDYKTVKVEMKDGIAILYMNNPPVNQLSEHFVREMADALTQASTDAAVKAAQVTLMEIRLPFALGGKAFAIFTGDVSAVRSSVESAVNVLKDEGVIESYVVIAQPHKELIAKLL